jgi:CRISPR-associated endonuclease/helicase Cas3
MDYLKLWGKTKEDGNAYPLICHMIDCSAVVREWLKNDTIFLDVFVNNIGIDIGKNELINLLLWIVAMHDIGKATVCFQNKVPFLAKKADIFDENRTNLPFNHGLFGAYLFSLYYEIKEAKEWNKEYEDIEYKIYSGLNNLKEIFSFFEKTNTANIIVDLLKASCWHHGNIFNSNEINNGFQNESERSVTYKRTAFLRDDLIGKLSEFFHIKQIKMEPRTKYHPSLLKSFAGFVSVCDWIASGDQIFNGSYNEDIEKHYEESCLKAKEAFIKLGLINVKKEMGKKDFAQFFNLPQRGIQSEVENIINKTENIDLLIIEAPTGEGKTEAALYSHYRLGNKGLYFALPSQATANQMFGRIEKFYKDQIKEEIPIILSHGMAWLNKDYNKRKKERKKLEKNSGYNSLNEWFYTRKKTLLAPVGVGTVDQAMLSVLKTKHYFVKLFALTGKTLIIDEVHAYDFFMIPIIRRLLEWCKFLRIQVILLSATLPEIMKKELISGYLGNECRSENIILKKDYPLISAISKNDIQQYPVESTRKTEKIKIKLYKYDGDIKEIITNIEERLSNGGNILWICNTVKRSQKVYDQLKKHFGDSLSIKLFHSRFTFSDRNETEKTITILYGKDAESAQRPYRSIIVSTQVVEQSLDVDFDYLITDIAPIDLLLQRFGRMHRHDRQERPEGFKNPECLILISDSEIKGPVKGKAKWKPAEDLKGFAEVYDPLVIYRTIKCLSENEIIELPGMYRPLVENVYSEDKTFTDITLRNPDLEIKKEVWEISYKKYMDDKNDMEKESAKYITESPVKPLDYIEGVDITPLFEEDDGKATSFIAKTRYGNEIEANLIIARMNADKIVIGETNYDLNDYYEDGLTFGMQKNIMENSVKMSNPKDLVIKILKREIKTYESDDRLDRLQEEIYDIPALRNNFIVILDEKNKFNVGKYDIEYSNHSGLKILKEEDEE